MGPWPNVVDATVDTLVSALEEYEKQQKLEEYKFEINVSNGLAAYGRFSDMLGIAGIALSDNVNWFGDSTKTNVITPVVKASFVYIINQYNYQFNSFQANFIVSLIISVVYGVLGTNAAKHARNNTLGLDEVGSRAKFPHRQFLLTKSVGFLGSAQFMYTMTNFIDTFVCNFNTVPYTLYRDDTIVCLGDQHFLYMALAFIGIGIYYPLSTFLYPDFQYGDKSLDMKYKAVYLVLYV